MFNITTAIGVMVATLMIAFPAQADLLANGQDWREINFEVIEDKPFIEVRVGTTFGKMMFDNGTPHAVFLNRDALDLPEGPIVGKGQAASGQPVEVRLHDAPTLAIGGQAYVTASKIPSGNFDFVEVAYGSDYFGFIGTPAVENGAFVLDYERQVMTILRTQTDGKLNVPLPAPQDVLAQLTFSMTKGEQPTSAAFIGSLAIVLDFDTGDTGALYLRPDTRKRLEMEGLLVVSGNSITLTKAFFGGMTFEKLAISRLVEAGGPQDVRPWPGSDSLRLGGAFLAEFPSLWNFPAGTITFLRSGSNYLKPRLP